MLSSRTAQKYNRVTVTLVPTSDDRGYRSVPSTLSPSHRAYEWRKAQSMHYMIVPRRVTGAKIELDVFVDALRKGTPKQLQKVVADFVQAKIETEWKGLKLGAVGRAGSGVPPRKTLVRGSIEDILGVAFEG